MPSFKVHPKLTAEQYHLNGIDAFVRGDKNSVIYQGGYLQAYHQSGEGGEEANAAFISRKSRAYCKKFTRRAHKTHLAHLAQTISTSGFEGGQLDDIRKDITGFNQSLEDFSRDAMALRLKYGRFGILVDGPSSVAPTLAEAAAQGERSYAVLYSTRDILWWECFKHGPRKGQLKSLVLRDQVEKNEEGEYQLYRRFFFADKSSQNYSWQTLKSRDSNIRAVLSIDKDIDVEVIEKGEGELDEIPFVLVDDTVEESAYFDGWELEAAHINILSAHTNIIFQQGFRIVVISGTNVDQETVARGVSEATIWTFRGENVSVHIVPAGDPTASEKDLIRLENQLWRMLMFDNMKHSDDTRQVQSTSSRAKDEAARVDFYDSTLDVMEGALSRVLQLIVRFESGGESDVALTFARDYGLEDAESELAHRLATNAQARELGVTDVQKELLKLNISELRLLPDDDGDVDVTRQRLYDAVDAAQSPEQGEDNDSFGSGLTNSGDISIADLAA